MDADHDTRQPPAGAAAERGTVDLPAGAPQRVAFAGLLDGRRRDDAALGNALDELRALGVDVDLELRGGRFSVMPDEAAVDGAGFDQGGRQRFLDGVEALVAAAEPGSVESTLRCTLYFPEQVVETLFTVQGGEVRAVSRARPRQPGERDSVAAPDPASLAARRKLLWMLPLLLVAFGLLAWRSGLVDQAFATASTDLELLAGPFGDTLELEVERVVRGYRVGVRRGPDYPESTAAVDAALAAAATPLRRAAVRAVADGGEVWVQLRAADDRVLAAAAVDLAPLLSDADSPVRVTLPGRIGAARLRLALDPGRPR